MDGLWLVTYNKNTVFIQNMHGYTKYLEMINNTNETDTQCNLWEELYYEDK